MHLEPGRHVPPRVRSLMPSQTPTTFFATEGTAASPWLHSTRHVRIVSPSALPDSGQVSMVQESPTPASMISPADSQLTGVDSDDVSFTATHRDSEPTSSAHSLLGRRTQLRRNAHPLRYVKRAVMPLNTISSSNSEKRHQHSLDTAELSDLKHINAQYVIACPFLTTPPQTEAYIQSVRVCDSKAITQHLIHILLFFSFSRIQHSHPNLLKAASDYFIRL